MIAFASTDCRPCPSRERCTTAARGIRMFTLRPSELHGHVAAARAQQATDTWQATHALRVGVEGTINQALNITGLHRARYRGLPKVTLQHALSATAINIIRPDAHWTSRQPDQPTNPGQANCPASPTNSAHSPGRSAQTESPAQTRPRRIVESDMERLPLPEVRTAPGRPPVGPAPSERGASARRSPATAGTTGRETLAVLRSGVPRSRHVAGAIIGG
ncbi:hypothetical protein GCM10009639_09500 [Kitasatospora putterlickiae]|uniref:Transposase DDE domain-containing protein n=1 Tax=Kitasatospora putterlickiae TaxID=221725 RepID=A0ABP4IAQ8_9ACTN